MIDYYFTGIDITSDAGKFLLEVGGCILLSQFDRTPIKKIINEVKASDSKLKVFIDSGAFSAWTKGKPIDIDEYISFLNSISPYITVAASVDVIPGAPRSSEVPSHDEILRSGEQTWKNYLYMRERLDEPDKLIFTYHFGEPEEYLTRALEYEDEKGKIKYIAFGGLVGKPAANIELFLTRCFQLIKNSSNPDIKTHAFGMTKTAVMQKFHLTSVDSTSIVLASALGKIIVNDKDYAISSKNKDQSILNLSETSKEYINESVLNKYGFTIDDLKDNSNNRLTFNVKSTYDFMSHLEVDENKNKFKFKPSLW